MRLNGFFPKTYKICPTDGGSPKPSSVIRLVAPVLLCTLFNMKHFSNKKVLTSSLTPLCKTLVACLDTARLINRHVGTIFQGYNNQ